MSSVQRSFAKHGHRHTGTLYRRHKKSHIQTDCLVEENYHTDKQIKCYFLCCTASCEFAQTPIQKKNGCTQLRSTGHVHYPFAKKLIIIITMKSKEDKLVHPSGVEEGKTLTHQYIMGNNKISTGYFKKG